MTATSGSGDITNPTAPSQVSEWAIQDAGGPFAAQGCDADGNYGHSAEPAADGKLAFIAYWDSGFVALDLDEPASPVYKGHTVYGTDEDIDSHSSQYDEARKLLFTATKTSARPPGPGSRKATATCGCGTTRG